MRRYVQSALGLNAVAPIRDLLAMTCATHEAIAMISLTNMDAARGHSDSKSWSNDTGAGENDAPINEREYMRAGISRSGCSSRLVQD